MGNISENLIVGWIKSDELPHINDHDIDQLEEYNTTGDKLLGYPNWVQGYKKYNCKICDETMKFIFQLTSNGELDWRHGWCLYLYSSMSKTS